MDVEQIDTSPLDLEESLPMQRVFWRLEWLFFGAIALVMILSLAGLFGDGWLSRTQASSGDLTVRYEQFIRRDKRTILEVELSSKEFAVSLDYFADFRLDLVVPTPSSQSIVDNEIVFEFDAGPERYTARMYIIPLNPVGWTSATLRSRDALIELSHFTFP